LRQGPIVRIRPASSPVDVQELVASEAQFNYPDAGDSERIVHVEYISHLTYTRSWLKVGRN